MSRALGGRVVDAASLEMDFAAGDRLKARQHAQECRLSASGRAEKDKKLAVRDSQVDIVDRRHAAPGFGDMLESDRGHWIQVLLSAFDAAGGHAGDDVALGEKIENNGRKRVDQADRHDRMHRRAELADEARKAD